MPKPFTDHHPKALAEVNGKTLLQRNIEYLQQFGIYDVIINVHHFAAQVIQTIKDNGGWGSNISISDETDAILETGGGLKRAAWFFKDEEDLVLMNSDVLTDMPLDKMIAFHKENNPLATLATSTRETSRYFLFDKCNVLCGWKNVKTGAEKIMCSPQSQPLAKGGDYFPTGEEGLYFSDTSTGEGLRLTPKAFSGIHVVNTKIFSLIQQSKAKFSMVDVYLSLCAQNKILSFDHFGARFIDVGKPESLIQAAILFNNDFRIS